MVYLISQKAVISLERCIFFDHQFKFINIKDNKNVKNECNFY